MSRPRMTRRRLGATALALTSFAGLGVALAPGAAAGAVYGSGHTTCLFSVNHYQIVQVWWERSSSGGSRHGYKAAFGSAAGASATEPIKSINFWESFSPFGDAYNGSYIVYFSSPTYSYATPAQPSSRMPYEPNSIELHLNVELVRADGTKCRREWRIFSTGATRDG